MAKEKSSEKTQPIPVVGDTFDLDRMQVERSVIIQTKGGVMYTLTPTQYNARVGKKGNMICAVRVTTNSSSLADADVDLQCATVSRWITLDRSFRVYDDNNVIAYESDAITGIELDPAWDGLAKGVRLPWR